MPESSKQNDSLFVIGGSRSGGIVPENDPLDETAAAAGRRV